MALARAAAPEAQGAAHRLRKLARNALEASILNYPDYLVFDIDPYIYSGKEAKGAEPELNKRGFAVGKRVAFWLRALLQADVARGGRQDLGQDRPARVRADRAHA